MGLAKVDMVPDMGCVGVHVCACLTASLAVFACQENAALGSN